MNPEMNTQATFGSQVPVDASDVMFTLKSAGFPLSSSTESVDGDNNKLVCIAEVKDDLIAAIVALPSGNVYRFEPSVFQPVFWSFAARHYYFVTGNMADRVRVAELVGIDVKEIKGRTLTKGKGETLSGLTLDQMMSQIKSMCNKHMVD